MDDAQPMRSAILGANGSGKSTLLRTITGFIYPTEGNVWLLGEQLGKTVLDVLRRRVGMVDPAPPIRWKER